MLGVAGPCRGPRRGGGRRGRGERRRRWGGPELARCLVRRRRRCRGAGPREGPPSGRAARGVARCRRGRRRRAPRAGSAGRCPPPPPARRPSPAPRRYEPGTRDRARRRSPPSTPSRPRARRPPGTRAALRRTAAARRPTARAPATRRVPPPSRGSGSRARAGLYAHSGPARPAARRALADRGSVRFVAGRGRCVSIPCSNSPRGRARICSACAVAAAELRAGWKHTVRGAWTTALHSARRPQMSFRHVQRPRCSELTG